MSCTVVTEGLLVHADPTEIHQIVMNLCTNAYQAMEGSAGRLKISLEPALLNDGGVLGTGAQLVPGAHLKLTVSDTGRGMDEEIMKHIFDPFFTTKRRDKGTGLGLATVQRIVTELKGGILVESALGRGTTFTIYLPAAEEAGKPVNRA